jgi:hypothetical protein
MVYDRGAFEAKLFLVKEVKEQIKKNKGNKDERTKWQATKKTASMTSR